MSTHFLSNLTSNQGFTWNTLGKITLHLVNRGQLIHWIFPGGSPSIPQVFAPGWAVPNGCQRDHAQPLLWGLLGWWMGTDLRNWMGSGWEVDSLPDVGLVYRRSELMQTRSRCEIFWDQFFFCSDWCSILFHGFLRKLFNRQSNVKPYYLKIEIA